MKKLIVAVLVLAVLGGASGCGTMISNNLAKNMSRSRVEGTDGGVILGFDVRAAADHPIVTAVGVGADVITYGGVYLLAKELNEEDKKTTPTYYISGDAVFQSSGGDSTYNRDSQNAPKE